MERDPVMQITYTPTLIPEGQRLERLADIVRASYRELGKPLDETLIKPREIASVIALTVSQEARIADYLIYLVTERFWETSQLAGFKTIADTDFYSLRYRAKQAYHPHSIFMLYLKEEPNPCLP